MKSGNAPDDEQRGLWGKRSGSAVQFFSTVLLVYRAALRQTVDSQLKQHCRLKRLCQISLHVERVVCLHLGLTQVHNSEHTTRPDPITQTAHPGGRCRV